MCVSLCVHLGLHISSLEKVRKAGTSSQNAERSASNRSRPSEEARIRNRVFWISFNNDRCVPPGIDQYKS